MKRTTESNTIAIVLAIAALVMSVYLLYCMQTIPNQIQKESTSYLDQIKNEVKDNLESEEALENTFNYVSKFSKYEGRVTELRYLYETDCLSEAEVRKQLKGLILEVNDDPNLQYLDDRYYEDIDNEEVEFLLEILITDLNQEGKDALSFYKIRD